MRARDRMYRVALVVLILTVAGCATQLRSSGAEPAQSGQAESERQIVVTFRDGGTVLRSLPGSTSRVYGAAPAYGGTAWARQVVASLAQDYSIDWVADWRIDLLDVHCAVFRARSPSERNALLTRLTGDSRVESVQPMHMFRTQQRAGPEQSEKYNDPYFSLQKGVETMRVPQAHQWSRGRGVSVAVIDTGVDQSHPELAGRIRGVRNFVDTDRERFSSDRHGTAVAGVIAAISGNNTGIVGVAPASQLIALKACWHELPAAPAVCSTLTLAEAIAFAVRERARVINLSLGGPSDPLLSRLLAEAMKRGIIVVGASPASPGEARGFPVDVPGVIAVADSDEPESAPRISQSQAAAGSLAAPGHEVLTLVPGQRYDYVSGSSISAALVSGVIALLLERRSELSGPATLALLEKTSRTPQEHPLRIVDACDAVAALVSAPACAQDDGTQNLAAAHR